MTALYFYGTLCHVPLLEAVLERPVGALNGRLYPAVLPDHLVSWVKDEPYPMIERKTGCHADGLLLIGVTEDEQALLTYYEGAFSYHLSDVMVLVDGEKKPAVCFYPMSSDQTRGAPWVLQDWVTIWGDMAVGAARDVMARRARYDAETAASLRPFLMARHWARKLARGTPAPATERRAPVEDDVTVTRQMPGYRGFFELAEFEFNYKRFDETRSPTISREAFLAFDAALVLPYDPQLDQVLLIEQLRFGPLWRDDPNPWIFEPIAGLVDAGENPEDTARREAVEEAGLELGPLEVMTRFYASPGYSTEYFHCFLGLTDLSGFQTTPGGLLAEHEDIRSHIMSFEAAMALTKSGEINAGPLIMMLYWLAVERPRLQGTA